MVKHEEMCENKFHVISRFRNDVILYYIEPAKVGSKTLKRSLKCCQKRMVKHEEMCENKFHVISRFRNDVILYYPTLEQKTGKRGHPKWFDGRIDFANLDLTRCKEYEVNKGKLYGLRVYAQALKRYVSLAIWYPMDERTDKWQLYFSTDDSMDGREVLDYYRTRFQLEFCFRDGKQHAGITSCRSTDFRKLDFHFNASLAAVNLAKAACKRLGITYSISSCKSFIHNAYMLERFICVFQCLYA